VAQYPAAVPARVKTASPDELAAALARFDAGDPPVETVRLLVKHYLAVLAQRHPGGSVEVRVPPYAAVQCVGGTRHTRGTPPAVVESDPFTWIRLARGHVSWAEATSAAAVTASGERSDLTALLPLTGRR
jgi:hypothetical protein